MRCDFEDMYGEPIDSEPYEEAVEEAIDIIRDAPTIDVVKHGRWMYTDDMYETLFCSRCGYDTKDYIEYLYCPMCGARMDAKRKEL